MARHLSGHLFTLVRGEGLGHKSKSKILLATPPHSSNDIVPAFKSPRKQNRLLPQRARTKIAQAKLELILVLVRGEGLEPPAFSV